jgi:hypothetical protein|tara:strand:- start:2325 stop:2819 length:495 start_codon:yes stop_codon:yes gene_type:complete
MKTIFFNYPVGSPKVSLITTSKRVSQLMSDEVIPKNAGYVEHDLIDENSNRNDLAMVGMPQHLKFDNVKKPTQVLWDMDLIEVYILSLIRNQRGVAFGVLDTLAMRALTKGLSDVVAEVEADKQTLRDMPDTVNLSGATDYWTAYESVPNAFIDFEAKYNPKLV